MDNFIYNFSDSPVSSVIYEIFYSQKTHRLVIKFNNGSYQGYDNVTKDEYLDFIDADSTGQHYNKYFRGSVKHPKFNVDSVELNNEPWNDTPGATATDGKDFTVIIKIKATDIVDAATKVHGFTAEAFTIVSLSEG